MNSKIIFIAVILFSMVINGCKEKEEFNIELIPGEYTGMAFNYSSAESGGGMLISSDPSKGSEFKTKVRKIGSNFVLSFDQSFNYKIPDITIEIAATKDSEVVSITTLPGQPYSSLTREYTYRNEPSNYFSHDEFIRRINLNLTLISNDPDSIPGITIKLLKLY